MFTIDSTIDIAAPLAEVRTAITTEAGYRAWFAQDADFDGRQGTFRFAQPNETRSVTFRVDRCDDSGIVMTCIAHENNPDWLGPRSRSTSPRRRPGRGSTWRTRATPPRTRSTNDAARPGRTSCAASRAT